MCNKIITKYHNSFYKYRDEYFDKLKKNSLALSNDIVFQTINELIKTQNEIKNVLQNE